MTEFYYSNSGSWCQYFFQLTEPWFPQLNIPGNTVSEQKQSTPLLTRCAETPEATGIVTQQELPQINPLGGRTQSQAMKPHSLHSQTLPPSLDCSHEDNMKRGAMAPPSHSGSLIILPWTSFYSNPIFLLTLSFHPFCEPVQIPSLPLSSLLFPGGPLYVLAWVLVRLEQWEDSAGDLRTWRVRHGVGSPGSSLYEGKGTAPGRHPLL